MLHCCTPDWKGGRGGWASHRERRDFLTFLVVLCHRSKVWVKEGEFVQLRCP